MRERRQERYTEYHGTVRAETTEYTGYFSASSSTATAIQTVVNNDMGPLPQEPSAHTTPSAPGVNNKTTDTLPAVSDDNHMDSHPLVQDQQSDDSDTLLSVQGDQSNNASNTAPPSPTELPATAAVPTVSVNNRLVKLLSLIHISEPTRR